MMEAGVRMQDLLDELRQAYSEYRKELERLDPAEHTEYAFLFTEEQPSWQYLLQ